MIKLPTKIAPGVVISVSRQLRPKAKAGNPAKRSLKEQGQELGLLLAELDRRGFDADVVIRRKRGRPSDVSRFLQKQNELI